MNNVNLKYFQSLFHEMLKELGKFEDNLNLVKNEKGDFTDKTMEDRDNFLLLKLKGRKKFFIKKIKAALDRVNEGTFGICKDCGERIEINRLKARPMTTLCITCKEEQEKMESHILYHRKSHTHGKSLVNNQNNNEYTVFTGEEIPNEKILKFNKNRMNAGLKASD